METTYDQQQALPGPVPGRAFPQQQVPRGRMERQPAAPSLRRELASDPAAQAREILHLGFTVAPLVAGADKFFDALVDWERYLDPRVASSLGMSKRRFMRMVGVVEIAAGTLVALKPKYGSWVVAGWLGGIVGNLLLQRDYYDIALRDFGLMLGAIALGRLESAH